MKSAVKIFLLLLLLFLAVAGLSFYWTWFKLKPSLDDPVEMNGLSDEVSVRWDDWQVPHIDAQREDDAFMVMGYLHAQDRLWQMAQHQYKLEGLHSREIDESLIKLDRFYLTLSFGEIAREAFENLPERDKQYLEAYAYGVNQYVEQNEDHLPVEFTLSDARPVEWKAWHAVGVQLLWAWEHQQAFWTKPAFNSIHEHENDSLSRTLTGLDVPHTALFGDQPPVVDSTTYHTLLDDFLTFTRGVYPARTGYTGTGLAVSVQSPQPMSVVSVTDESRLMLPDQGYEMVLRVNGFQRAGITIPGFPVMIQGQNESIAWALQPLVTDDGDFSAGELFTAPVPSPVDWKTDASIYDHLDDEISISRRMLSLKNGGEHQLIIRKAYDRPIVAISETNNRYLAFNWPGLQPPVDFGSYLDIASAGNRSEIEEAVNGIQWPAVQLLFTTTEGQAGLLTGGSTLSPSEPLKIRPPGDHRGLLSADSGYNEEVRSDGQPVFFHDQLLSDTQDDTHTSIYSPPWDRSQRFLELFEDTPPELMKSRLTEYWPRDTYSSLAAELSPIITRILEEESSVPVIRLILPYLQNWNYEYRSNETAATLFEYFLLKSSRRLYHEFLDQPETDMLFTNPNIPISAVSKILMEPERWPADHQLSFQEWVSLSMREAAEDLADRYGDEPYDWQWAIVVQAAFDHTLFETTTRMSKAAGLAERNLFKMGDFGISGSSHTIHAGHINFRNPFKLEAATTRQRSMFLSPENEFFSILPSGQSANIFSDHYDDQFVLWKEGEMKYHPFHISSGTISFEHSQLFTP